MSLSVFDFLISKQFLYSLHGNKMCIRDSCKGLGKDMGVEEDCWRGQGPPVTVEPVKERRPLIKLRREGVNPSTGICLKNYKTKKKH